MKASKSIFGLAAAALFVGAGSAQAATVAATDFDTLLLGGNVNLALNDTFTNGIGSIVSQVFEDQGTYTYVMEVTAGHDNISEFNTAFEVLGFNGVAGFSFSEAIAASGWVAPTFPSTGSPSSLFEIELDGDGTLDWATTRGEIFTIITTSPALADNDWFDDGEVITFFFQSRLAPGGIDQVNMINSTVGTADTYAFVPTPTAAVIGLPMLGLLSLGRRRREQK